MRKAVIVHCWDGNPEYCWYPQTKKELESDGFVVVAPSMPETNAPKLKLWLPELKKSVGKADENTYLIGHSVGCVTIMRYLETVSEKEKVGGVVFVAGFVDDLGYAELKNFFETALDFEKIKSKANHFVAIYSDNDPYVPVKHSEILKEKLGAEIIFKPGMKHFSGPASYNENCASLPEVSQSILRMTTFSHS